MMILIISLRHDVHSLCVAYSLAKIGHRVLIWTEPNEAGTVTASVGFGTDGANLSTCGQTFAPESIDVVWMRRHAKIFSPPWVVPEDNDFVIQESNAFFRWLWGSIATKAKWLHSLTGHMSAEMKMLQIQAAQQTGLPIPETLFSNDPDAIRAFIRENERFGGSIYKTFYPMAWDEPEYIKPVHTTLVTEADFTDDEKIRAVPGIYQRRINKAFEVRSTFFGVRERSVKIDSQIAPDGAVDWRDIDSIDGYLSEYALPPDLREKCISYMQHLGIEIACFDFIVTPSGEHVFLETNQQGQFLWIEQAQPSIPMLKEICCLLLGATPLTSSEWTKLDIVSLQDLECDVIFQSMRSSLRESGFLDTGAYFDAR